MGAPDIPDVPGMRICQQRQIYRVQQLQRPDKKPLRRKDREVRKISS
ncbi:hypothetical protein CLOBOL_06830 [Enterocloster bolteae ATCC BAA-613]|uniref:Uncharacterized protein n=1 Tax=Enterocloster bolteae (strain ATCC BAA-613 / DSM 15670 / CCUG 46953 / JCM 12243 / WAL 16351) TaxID=411902 RepID=A8S465_ENTBW|nr:hypothetical protein CLOBOL_06830 [Enterocloster bolteae ATCC BAA-613]